MPASSITPPADDLVRARQLLPPLIATAEHVDAVALASGRAARAAWRG